MNRNLSSFGLEQMQIQNFISSRSNQFKVISYLNSKKHYSKFASAEENGFYHSLGIRVSLFSSGSTFALQAEPQDKAAIVSMGLLLSLSLRPFALAENIELDDLTRFASSFVKFFLSVPNILNRFSAFSLPVHRIVSQFCSFQVWAPLARVTL